MKDNDFKWWLVITLAGLLASFLYAYTEDRSPYKAIELCGKACDNTGQKMLKYSDTEGCICKGSSEKE